MCEKAVGGLKLAKFAELETQAAADAGEFNVSEWATNSSSVKGLLAWARRNSVNPWLHCNLPAKFASRTGPLVWRVLSLLDWRRPDLRVTKIPPGKMSGIVFHPGNEHATYIHRKLRLSVVAAKSSQAAGLPRQVVHDKSQK